MSSVQSFYLTFVLATFIYCNLDTYSNKETVSTLACTILNYKTAFYKTSSYNHNRERQSWLDDHNLLHIWAKNFFSVLSFATEFEQTSLRPPQVGYFMFIYLFTKKKPWIIIWVHAAVFHVLRSSLTCNYAEICLYANAVMGEREWWELWWEAQDFKSSSSLWWMDTSLPPRGKRQIERG